MNHPTNSNIGDVLSLNSIPDQVYVKPQQVEIYGNALLESVDRLLDNYEYQDEYAGVAELPLTKTEIIDVVMMRLQILCEEYLFGIAGQALTDRVLKEMIERQVKLKTKQAA